MQAVIGKDLKPIPATLVGYQRFKFEERTYPGIIKNEGRYVEGTLYKNIDEKSLSALDQFEGIMYERRLLDVQVGNETKQAFVYLTKDEYRDCLSEKEWSLDKFKRKYLNLYLRDISEF